MAQMQGDNAALEAAHRDVGGPGCLRVKQIVVVTAPARTSHARLGIVPLVPEFLDCGAHPAHRCCRGPGKSELCGQGSGLRRRGRTPERRNQVVAQGVSWSTVRLGLQEEQPSNVVPIGTQSGHAGRRVGSVADKVVVCPGVQKKPLHGDEVVLRVAAVVHEHRHDHGIARHRNFRRRPHCRGIVKSLFPTTVSTAAAVAAAAVRPGVLIGVVAITPIVPLGVVSDVLVAVIVTIVFFQKTLNSLHSMMSAFSRIAPGLQQL